MHCAEFEHRLNDLLDHRAAPDADEPLRLHADDCDRCRRLLADQDLVLTGLSLWEPPALPSDFSRKVLAAYRPDAVELASEPPVAPRSYWLPGLLATSLVALLALGIAWWNNQPAPRGPVAPPTIVKQPVTPAPQPERIQPPRIVRQPPTPEIAPAPSKTPQQIARAEVDLQELLGAVQEQFPEMNPERGTQIAEQVVGGLQPLAAPVGDVFNVLRRTIGGGKDHSMRPRKPQASNLFPVDRDVA